MSTERSAHPILAGLTATTVLGACMLLLSACPGTLENKDAFTTGGGGGDGCGDVETALVGARCATANCHDAAAKAGSLDLTPGEGLAARLVDVASVTCMGAKIVDSAAPEQSTMYTKVLETNACGLRMPGSGMKLTDAEEQCLLTWLSEL